MMEGVPGVRCGRRHFGGTSPGATAAAIQPTRPRPPPQQAAAAICAHATTGAPWPAPPPSVAAAVTAGPTDARSGLSRRQTSLPVVATNITARGKCNSLPTAVEDDAAGGVYTPPQRSVARRRRAGGDGRPILGGHGVYCHLIAVLSSPRPPSAALPLPPFALALAGVMAGGWLEAVTPVATRVSVAAVLAFRPLSAAGGNSATAGRGPCVGAGGGGNG